MQMDVYSVVSGRLRIERRLATSRFARCSSSFVLTLCTLNTRSVSIVILIHVVTIGLCRPALTVVRLLESDLVHVHLGVELGKSRALGQRLLEKWECRGIQCLGEVDVHADKEVAHLVVAEGRHTLTSDGLEASWLYNLSRDDSDVESVVVEVGDDKLAASQGSEEVNVDLGEEVVSLALEALVVLLLDDYDDVSGDNTGSLVALACKLDLLARLHSLVDVDLEDLALLLGLLAVTLLAAVLGVHDLASSLTLVTGLLDLLHHRTELTVHDLVALATTRVTGLDGALLATDSVTAAAENRLGESKLLDLALVQVLERDGDTVNKILSTTRSSWATATTTKEATTTSAKQLREEVLWVHSAHAAATLESLLSCAVVDFALVLVRQDFVCVCQVLEELGVSSLIGVVLERPMLSAAERSCWHSLFPVGLLDLVISGRWVDA